MCFVTEGETRFSFPRLWSQEKMSCVLLGEYQNITARVKVLSKLLQFVFARKSQLGRLK